MLRIKQWGIKYHFFKLRYDSTWDWTSVFQATSKHCMHRAQYWWLRICQSNFIYVCVCVNTCLYTYICVFVHVWNTGLSRAVSPYSPDPTNHPETFSSNECYLANFNSFLNINFWSNTGLWKCILTRSPNSSVTCFLKRNLI